MFKNTLLASISMCVCLSTSAALAHNESVADDHAPIGVMGDHNHKQGEWMMSYRHSMMSMEGNLNGTDSVSTADIHADFMVAPLKMDMEMHMIGAMYGATDKLTIMGMIPYVKKEMSAVNRMNVHFKTRTEGLGDVKLSGLYTLYESGKDPESHRTKHKVLLKAGLSLPTGSIDERGHTPMGTDQKLPYGMQLGSGTVDPMLGLTYTQKHDGWSWGAQASTTLRFGENDEGYRLGNEYGVTSWVAHDIKDFASLSIRLEGKKWDDIHGQDDDLNPMMTPGARADLRAGERIDALFGVNLLQNHGTFKNHRLAVEFGMPLYQKLDGPQMETDYRVMLGWQYAF